MEQWIVIWQEVREWERRGKALAWPRSSRVFQFSLFFYIFTPSIIFCDLVENHMRDTSSNDLSQLPGRAERILDAGEGSVPVAAQRKEPSFEGKRVQVNESGETARQPNMINCCACSLIVSTQKTLVGIFTPRIGFDKREFKNCQEKDEWNQEIPYFNRTPPALQTACGMWEVEKGGKKIIINMGKRYKPSSKGIFMSLGFLIKISLRFKK